MRLQGAGPESIIFMVERLEAGDFYILSRQRRTAVAHPVGGARYRRKPPRAVAMASGFRRLLCSLCEANV